MTVDTPLTCYMCGRTREEWVTVDLIGCLKDQESAEERFREKFEMAPSGFLFVCPDCRKQNPKYAKNVEKKYKVEEG